MKRYTDMLTRHRRLQLKTSLDHQQLQLLALLKRKLNRHKDMLTQHHPPSYKLTDNYKSDYNNNNLAMDIPRGGYS